MTHIIALLLVQDQPPAPAPGGGLFSPLFLIQMGLVIAIFYFLLIRPQKKQRDAHEDRLRNIRKGDEVVTAGGIVGKIESIKETLKDGVATKTMEDRVTIRSAESRLVVERGRIARVITEPAIVTTTETKTPT
jgi:preprotein translocase subunit YajC